MTRIVATGPVAAVAEEILGEIVVADDATLLAVLPEAEVLIARGGGRVVSAGMIESATRLRVIGRSGVGVSEIDVAAATRRGIPVVITPDAGASAVAEGALALILALTKRLPELDRAVREGRWSFRDEADLGDLEGGTLGIVGFGRIGRRLAALAEPFGTRVLVHDPYVADERAVPLRTLLAESDFVSLHAPLTDETRGLVDADVLSAAKPGAILVNLARGALVSSPDDLLAALESGRLAGVGLDVFEPEPPDLSHPLYRHANVLLSPHALGTSRRARERIFRDMAEGVAAVLRGDRPAAVANPEIYES